MTHGKQTTAPKGARELPNEFLVRVTVTAPFQSDRPAASGALTREYRFSRLPIRIGRAQDNDLELPSQFVSGRHARIEEVGGTLCVRDLGSRNGVHVFLGAESVRIAPQSAVPVSSDGFELQLGSETRLRVERASSPTPEPPRSPAHAAPQPHITLTSLPELSGLGDGLPPLPDLRRPLRSLPALDVPPGVSAPAAGFEPVQPDPREHACGRARDHAAGLRTGNFELSPEVLAMQGLRELVASLSPGRTLDTQGDVARLVTRLHDVFEVVCRSYLSLRNWHAKFVASLHLDARADHDPARIALDTARDASAVAALLLDFSEPAADASHALELALKELGVHQVALLDGVMQGIRALLDELSPASIQRDVEDKRSAPRLGRPERALWDEYCERYARLAQEGEAFSRVFGAEFATAYRQYQHSRRSR